MCSVSSSYHSVCAVSWCMVALRTLESGAQARSVTVRGRGKDAPRPCGPPAHLHAARFALASVAFSPRRTSRNLLRPHEPFHLSILVVRTDNDTHTFSFFLRLCVRACVRVLLRVCE